MSQQASMSASQRSDNGEDNTDIHTEADLKAKFQEHLAEGGNGLFPQSLTLPSWYTLVPITRWLPNYIRGGWRKGVQKDLFAGLVMGIMLIPQGMAYAMTALVPPQYGFFTAIAPSLIYMVLGSCDHLQVGVNAPISIMVAQAIQGANLKTEADRVNGMLTVTILSGCMYFLMIFLRLDLICTLIPDPMLSGLVTAMAFQIMTTNMKFATGINDLNTNDFISTWVDIFTRGQLINPIAVGYCIAGCIFLLGMKSANQKYCKKLPIPEQLVLLVLAIIVTWLSGVSGKVKVIGAIPMGLQAPVVPTIIQVSALAPSAAVIALVNYILSSQVAASMGIKHGYTIDNRQELIAFGTCSIVGSFFGSLPPSGGFSRSALLSSLDSKSPLHNVVSSVVVAVVACALTGTLFHLPHAILASIIIVALRSMVQYDKAIELWKISKPEFLVWLGSFLFTLLLGTTYGLAASIGLALVVLIHSQARPYFCVLGQIPGTNIYRDVAVFQDAQEHEGILIFRWDASLNFANRKAFEEAIDKELLKRSKMEGRAPVGALIFEASAVSTVDSSAAASIRNLCNYLKKNYKVKVFFVRFKAVSRKMLVRMRMQDVVNDSNIFLTTSAAVTAAHEYVKQLRSSHCAAVESAVAAAAASQDEARPDCADECVAIHISSSAADAALLPGRPSTECARVPAFSVSESTAHGILANEGFGDKHMTGEIGFVTPRSAEESGPGRVWPDV